MSEARGKLLTCDRCGTTVFVKEGEYLYEKAPEGWAYHGEPELNGAWGCHLCPNCEKRYRGVLKDFMEHVYE